MPTTKRPPSKTRSPSLKAANAQLRRENTELRRKLQARDRDLGESLEQQSGTSDILRMIARASGDLQSVLDAIAESAARLCSADDAIVWRVSDNVLVLAAHFGPIPTVVVEGGGHVIDRDTPAGRAVVDGQTIHVHDLVAAASDFPRAKTRGIAVGVRTALAAPLLREGNVIGAIHIRRTEVRPFSEKQIKLLETFADQAVIAIENVRLFKELQERNAELREALEHQTATSEVLGIISRSPTDVQPVLDAIVESAARVCGIDDVVLRLHEGELSIPRAHFGPIPIGVVEISIDEPRHRWVREHGTLHIPDVRSQDKFPTFGRGATFHTQLIVPLRQQREVVGTLGARRTEVRPFTPAQIKLLETFADQAVIAIENVRLFQELKEALEQQTATSEILGVIASSPTDIQPVLDAVAESAARLCDATNAQIFRFDSKVLRLAANYGGLPASQEWPINRSSPVGRIFIDRKTLHVHDVAAELETEFPESREAQRRLGIRTILGTPLLREDVPLGVIGLRRMEVRPFTEQQIKLLETFASQAVIAIENVRLFQELKESLEQQTATSEILGVIASSPTDIQPVLDTVAERAARLCDAVDAQIWRVEGDRVRFAAQYGSIPSPRIEEGRPIIRGVAGGRAILDRETVHIPDTFAPHVQTEFPETWAMTHEVGIRTLLATPLLREGLALGYILIRRLESRPFSEKQVALLKTFADQSVIAIENVRLFQELTEALEQQTATSEILGVIASSPTDIQPVLDVVAESAARLCDATDAQIQLVEADFLRTVASYGLMPVRGREERWPINPGHAPSRAIIDRQTVHIHDLAAQTDTEFPESKLLQQRFGTRTLLCAPLLREGVPLGLILIRRTEVRPFPDKQIKLLETFASQAVIAIENARLFNELDTRNRQLTETLEQQTATGKILEVIASSPTDVQPVLDTVAESAARLCDATDAAIIRVNGASLKTMAHYGPISASSDPPFDDRSSIPARAIVDRQTIHIHDLAAVSKEELRARFARSLGVRTVLATPLLREGVAIGAILIRRTEVRPFTDKQVALLKTFADQAVIAIENVRLFQELQERTRELVDSVEELKALGEVGQAVSSSLDLETVLETIVARAVDLSGTDCGVIYEFDEAAQEFNLRASHRMEAEAVEALRATRIRAGEGAAWQAAITRAPVQIPDTFDQRERSTSRIRPLLNRLGYRSLLTVPLLREQQILGRSDRLAAASRRVRS